MKASEKFCRHAVDVSVGASAVYGVASVAAASWLPLDARLNVLASLIVLVACLLYVMWFRPRMVAAVWWARYEVGAVHGVLVTLIERVPHRRSLFDPVDEVVLSCRNGEQNRDLEVTRIRSADYAAVAEGTQSFVMIETFYLTSWGPKLVSRRADPYTMTLDVSCIPVSAEAVPVTGNEPTATENRLMAQAGLPFVTAEDVRVLADQLARAVL